MEANMASGPTSSDDDEDSRLSQMIMDSGDEKASPDLYPRLHNVSAGFVYQAVLRAERPDPVEYVTIPLTSIPWTDEGSRLAVAIAKWNMQWEAAQYRRRIFSEQELPSPPGCGAKSFDLVRIGVLVAGRAGLIFGA